MSQTGTLEYTARAFSQDGKEAMRGHIDRALIELITNADDAYGEAEGRITIRIKPMEGEYAYLVSVHDSATGLTGDELINAFTKLGGKGSKLSSGGNSRGLLGRGAKDVAVFGKVVFSSIKAGKFSSLSIRNDAKWETTHEDIDAIQRNYDDLRLEQDASGLTAEIFVLDGKNFPRPVDLSNSLRNNAQLRDLIKRREVFISDERQLGAAGRLVCSLPVGSEVLRKEFTLEGYEGSATLVIRRLSEKQAGLPDETSAHGLLIKSGMTIFQNTWFDLSGRPAARFLCGEVEVPQIVDQLRHELEMDSSEGVSLLTRNRDGLQKEHDLFKKLQQAVTKVAVNIFDDVAKESQSGQKQGAELDRALKLAGDVIAPDLSSMLKELDDEMPPSVTVGGLGDFEAIPGVLIVKPGGRATITLRAIEKLTSFNLVPETVRANSPLTLAGSVWGQPLSLEWKKHPRLERFVAQCTVSVPDAEGIFGIKFTLGLESTTVQLVVRQPAEAPAAPPERLEFHPDVISSAPKRGKNLLLRAPLEYSGEDMAITLSGLVVDYAPDKVTLVPNESGSWVEAVVHIKTPAQEGHIDVTAISADVSIATAQLTVKEAGAKLAPGPLFNFELSGELDTLGRYAIDMVDGSFNLVIFGQHRGFGKVFGPFSDDLKKFTNEDEPSARAALAEVIAQALAQILIEKEYAKRPSAKWDPSATLVKLNKHAEKIVGKLHNALSIPDFQN